MRPLLLPPLRRDAARASVARARGRSRSRRGGCRRTPSAARSARRRGRPCCPTSWASRPCRARRAPRAAPRATSTASVKSVPGSGSRSRRSSSGWSTSSRRTGHGWKVIVPSCAAHAMTARWFGAISSAVRPEGNVMCAVSTYDGAPCGDALLVERLALESLARRDARPLDDTPGPALERGGPVAQGAQDPVAAREVVLHDFELGDADRREVRLLGVAHLHDVLADRELDGRTEGLRHGARRYPQPACVGRAQHGRMRACRRT